MVPVLSDRATVRRIVRERSQRSLLRSVGGCFHSVLRALQDHILEGVQTLERSGFSRNMQRSSLQMLISLTIAVGLHLNDSLRTKVFASSSYWIAVTCVILSEPTVGGVLKKGALRILGTFVGAGLGLITMVFADLAVQNPRQPRCVHVRV